MKKGKKCKTKVKKHKRRKKLGGSTTVKQHLRTIKTRVPKNKLRLIQDPVIKSLSIAAIEDPCLEIRKEAIDTIGDLEKYDSLIPLEYSLLNDRSYKVRKEAAEELGQLESLLAVPILEKALKTEKDNQVKKEIIKSLKKIGVANS